jgi:hypothetical protein
LKTWGEIKVMNDLKEQAKKIIAKGKLLNDVELINMGLDMLDALPSSELDSELTAVEQLIKPKAELMKQISPSVRNSDITEQFRVENKAPIDVKYGKKIALAVGERSNKFLDDGVEAADLKGKTPPAKPKIRRKVNKVEMTCTVCGKQKKVLKDLLYTEAYRCDDCIMKGKAR